MITRAAKILLVAGVAFFYLLVVFNNLTDFDSNYEFVKHVLAMDTTFPGNHGMWRALRGTRIHLVFYLGIIAWEMLNTLLILWGLIRMLRSVPLPVASFNAAKAISVMALTLSMMMWLVAFQSVGAEWFLMWH
jgi:predicted small integral membrane protein